MKKEIHPRYNPHAKVRCATCGAEYDFGSTLDEITVPICANCHPVYTGQNQVIVDTTNRVQSFNVRSEKTKELQEKLRKIQEQRQARQYKKEEVGVISRKSGNAKPTLKDLLKAGMGKPLSKSRK